MTYYIVAPEGGLIETKNGEPAPANWIFTIRPELKAFPQPSIHLLRTDRGYNSLRGLDILNKFKASAKQIPGFSPKVMQEGIIEGLETLVSQNAKLLTIYPDYIEKNG